MIIIAVVMAFRWRRMSKDRPLRLERLYILPAVYAVLVAVLLAERPPIGWEWVWFVIALIVGGAIGWYRGRTIRVTVDPGTHTLNQRASPAAFILLAALVLLRVGLRALATSQATAWHLSASATIDAFLGLALGLIAVQRLELYLRARRLLAEARAGGPPPSPPP